MTASSAKPSGKSADSHALDTLTGGAFSAPTSGERTARVREWLASNPSTEQMQEVFKELSARDKGAAKPLREKLDEIKRAKGQEAIAAEWADKAKALLAQTKINIADALAWQRDAAKAGAALSREPLASLKTELSERVRSVEDLQHRAQVQREAAVLLAHRIELLSTKSWLEAQAANENLRADIAVWQVQADLLKDHAQWASVDAKFPPLLEASRGQLLAVWAAFGSALEQAIAASTDAKAPLPGVPVWADELRAARGEAVEPPAPAVDPAIAKEQRAKANQAVQQALDKLEQEVAQGHGKATPKAAAELRHQLKEHNKHIDAALANKVGAALAAAGELEGWQRWRADQLREELVAKAEALLKAPEGQGLGGRKMQEVLRTMREQWKQTDQGGVPNHGLWKRFDHACTEAHKVVEAWLEKVKAESAEHKAQRLALIAEIQAVADGHATRTEPHDWKALSRVLHQFADRWRDGGHVGEKIFAEIQPQYKAAMAAAGAPLEAAQKASTERRHAMIAEAVALGAAPTLRIDAVRALQQRWQAEAQSVPIERKFEQKLWDAFRKPIDDAFQRKTAEREKAAAALGEHDRSVLQASKALDAASASGDAQAIRAAMAALEAALRGQSLAQEAVNVAAQAETAHASVAQAGAANAQEKGSEIHTGAEKLATETVANAEAAPANAEPSTEGAAPAAASADAPANAAPEAGATDTNTAGVDAAADGGANAQAAAPAATPKPTPKPVIAVRGDDRPGQKKAEPVAVGRGGKFGDRKDNRGSGRPGDNRFEPMRDGRGPGRRDDNHGERFAERGPRLGDAAFRAQREALEHAQAALKKLAIQAHGEVLTRVLGAWETRQADQLPSAKDLGARFTPANHAAWSKALAQVPSGDAGPALLRLEIAAELPTPAEHMDARRALQLQLLTRRNDPAPNQTWAQDAATVLAAAFDGGQARRLQNALKVLLKR